MNWDNIVNHWQDALDAAKRLGGEASQLVVEGPASEAEIGILEKELGTPLPASLRDTLLNFSKCVKFSWYLPEDFPLPEPLEPDSCGSFDLSLDDIYDAEISRREWIADVLSTRDEPELEAAWDDCFGFLNVATGDIVAIDISVSGQQPVIYLSHDDDEDIQRCRMGKDFQDFLARWSPLPR